MHIVEIPYINDSSFYYEKIRHLKWPVFLDSSYQKDMPQSKKLTEAIKHINHSIMIPTDWEEMYEEDFVEYDTGEYE